MSTSASKSPAETSSSTTNIDKRIVADNGAIVLGDGSKLETVSDDIALGAIDAMLKTTTAGAALASKLSEDSYSFAKNITGQSNATTTEALDTVRENNAAMSSVMETTATMLQKNANPQADTNNTAIKLAAGVAAAAVVGAVLIAVRKK